MIPDSRPVSRLQLRALPVLLALVAGSCGEPEPTEVPPNVVLIVMDTVRADHLSAYGYERPTTPFIDELCDSAVRYTHCRATGPWTLPSHASLFTGRFSFQHRARTEIDSRGVLRELPLSLKHLTLAEALGERGYRTSAFVANAAYLREEFQLDQGFGTYVVKREPGLEKNKAAFEWLSEGEQPFFLFLNYMDAHRPYNTRPLPGERESAFSTEDVVHTSTLLDELYAEVMGAGRAAPEELVNELLARYDTGIANADLAVGEVIAHLREQGLWENTLLVVTSDHGEFFGEHGLVEHSKDIYEEVLRIPLILKAPGVVPGSVSDELISLADLPHLVSAAMPPSLASELGALFPRQSLEDFSLAEISFSRGKDMAVYGNRFRRERSVIYSGKHKLIRSSDGQNELYDLEADPKELDNLFDSKPRLARKLTARLSKYINDNPGQVESADPVQLDGDALKALTELGYVGDHSHEDRDEEEEDQ